MNSYELMIILNPTLPEAEIKKQFTTLKEKIAGWGGKVKSEDFWGLKDLAYTMKKFKQAYYIVCVFEIDTIKIKDVSDFLNRQETSVVRHLITLVNPSDDQS